MASLASKFLGVRNGVASRVSRVVTQTKNVSSKSAAAAMTALSSKKGSMPLRSAIAPAPAAMLRTGAPCCASSAEADVVELQLKIEGMVCDGCSSRVLEALQKLAGVHSVHVDLEKGIATLEISAASQVDAFNELPRFLETVKDLGFEAQPHFE